MSQWGLPALMQAASQVLPAAVSGAWTSGPAPHPTGRHPQIHIPYEQ